MTDARHRDRPPPHLRDHLPPRRRQDHADRAPAARRRRHPARRQRPRQGRAPPHPLRLDGHRARPRHLGGDLGDDLRARRLRVQPARHARPRGLLRGHLPHAHRGGLRGDGDRRRQGHRGAHPQAVRDLPPARHPHRHLHQQDGPREPRPDRAAGRDRLHAGARHRAGDLAGGPRRRIRRHLRPARPRAAPDRRVAAVRSAPGRAGGRGGPDPRGAAGIRPRGIQCRHI